MTYEIFNFSVSKIFRDVVDGLRWVSLTIAHCENSTFAYIVSVLIQYFLAVHSLKAIYPNKYV